MTDKEVIKKHMVELSANQYSGLCPFHEEQTPSCLYNITNGIFNCFGCGKTGKIDELAAAYRKKGEEPAYEEGDQCPKCTIGKMDYKNYNACSCHIDPPCNNCIEAPLTCHNCGWNPVDEEDVVEGHVQESSYPKEVVEKATEMAEALVAYCKENNISQKAVVANVSIDAFGMINSAIKKGVLLEKRRVARVLGLEEGFKE